MKTIRLGEKLEFKAKVYPSVGYDYSLEYDTTAFSERQEYKYINPNETLALRLKGSDEGEVYYTLTSLKRGMFRIIEHFFFRGDETGCKEHMILVA